MSAYGPKQTSLFALHMSAFGGKADMTVYGNPRSRSLFGAKRTSLFAPHMSVFDPKRTFRLQYCPFVQLSVPPGPVSISPASDQIAKIGKDSRCWASAEPGFRFWEHAQSR